MKKKTMKTMGKIKNIDLQNVIEPKELLARGRSSFFCAENLSSQKFSMIVFTKIRVKPVML